METCQITFSYINKKCLEWNLDDNSNANESKMPLLWLSTRVFFQRSSKKVEWKSSLIWKLSKKLRGPRWRPVCGKLNSKRDCHVPPVHVNHATHRGIISKKEEEDGEVPTYSSSSPPLLHTMAAAPATEFSVSLSKRLIKYSTHGLSVFLLWPRSTILHPSRHPGERREKGELWTGHTINRYFEGEEDEEVAYEKFQIYLWKFSESVCKVL